MPKLPYRSFLEKDENEIWEFVYRKAVAQKESFNLLEVFKEFKQLGRLPSHGTTDIEYHFCQKMIPNLHKTDALVPGQILELYKHFKIKLTTELDDFLRHLTSHHLHLTSSFELKHWKIRKMTATIERPPRFDINERIPVEVQILMWKHIEKNGDVTGSDLRYLSFWKSMKLRKEHQELTPDMLVEFFLKNIRYSLFAMNLDVHRKMTLLQDLQLSISASQKLWLIRIDKVYVETNRNKKVDRWKMWKDEEELGELPMIPGYTPVRLYKSKKLQDAEKEELESAAEVLSDFGKYSKKELDAPRRIVLESEPDTDEEWAAEKTRRKPSKNVRIKFNIPKKQKKVVESPESTDHQKKREDMVDALVKQKTDVANSLKADSDDIAPEIASRKILDAIKIEKSPEGIPDSAEVEKSSEEPPLVTPESNDHQKKDDMVDALDKQKTDVTNSLKADSNDIQNEETPEITSRKILDAIKIEKSPEGIPDSSEVEKSSEDVPENHENISERKMDVRPPEETFETEQAAPVEIFEDAADEYFQDPTFSEDFPDVVGSSSIKMETSENVVSIKEKLEMFEPSASTEESQKSDVPKEDNGFDQIEIMSPEEIPDFVTEEIVIGTFEDDSIKEKVDEGIPDSTSNDVQDQKQKSNSEKVQNEVESPEKEVLDHSSEVQEDVSSRLNYNVVEKNEIVAPEKPMREFLRISSMGSPDKHAPGDSEVATEKKPQKMKFRINLKNQERKRKRRGNRWSSQKNTQKADLDNNEEISEVDENLQSDVKIRRLEKVLTLLTELRVQDEVKIVMDEILKKLCGEEKTEEENQILNFNEHSGIEPIQPDFEEVPIVKNRRGSKEKRKKVVEETPKRTSSRERVPKRTFEEPDRKLPSRKKRRPSLVQHPTPPSEPESRENRKRMFSPSLHFSNATKLITIHENDEVTIHKIKRQPTPPPVKRVTFNKLIKDGGDILKYYKEIDKSPISFEDNGISYNRENHKVEVTFSDKSRKAIVAESQARFRPSSVLEAIKKRRAFTPLSFPFPPIKRARASSTRNYLPTRPNFDIDHTFELFHKKRGAYPVNRDLDIPEREERFY